jgi:hypothetical protein
MLRLLRSEGAQPFSAKGQNVVGWPAIIGTPNRLKLVCFYNFYKIYKCCRGRISQIREPRFGYHWPKCPLTTVVLTWCRSLCSAVWLKYTDEILCRSVTILNKCNFYPLLCNDERIIFCFWHVYFDITTRGYPPLNIWFLLHKVSCITVTVKG